MSTSTPLDRRQFLGQLGLGVGAGAALASSVVNAQTPAPETAPAAADAPPANNGTQEFWPGGARLMISISMQFETGSQPASADSPFSGSPLPDGTPDLPATTWFQYGAREGIPRLLDLWDKHGIKVTSHMVGAAAEAYPELAKEIVQRGHEAAGHGYIWSPQHSMSRDEERDFIAKGIEAIKTITGETQIGYNCNWLRRSVNTLPLLQELGFLYHIDDVSRDEPFLIPVNGQDFVVVPYTLRNNDIVQFEGRNFSTQAFLQQLKDEFDQLYAEGATRRRQMSISTHDRIGGQPSIVKALDAFLDYAKGHPGVAFARKDEIARFALNSPLTPRETSAT